MKVLRDLGLTEMVHVHSCMHLAVVPPMGTACGMTDCRYSSDVLLESGWAVCRYFEEDPG